MQICEVHIMNPPAIPQKDFPRKCLEPKSKTEDGSKKTQRVAAKSANLSQ